MEEVGEDFTQSDLVSDDVMILDGGKTIFVWIGSGSNDDEKKDGPEYVAISFFAFLLMANINFFRIARRYAAGCTGRRKIQTITEGNEPVEFTGFFQGWQAGYDPNVVFEQMQQDMRKVAI